MKKLFPVLLVVAMITLVSCGDSSDSSSPMTGSDIRSSLTDNGYTCTDVKPYEPEADDMSLGIDPTEEFECDFPDGKLNVGIWDEPAGLTAAVAVIQGFACAFGADLGLITGANWALSLDQDEEMSGTVTAEEIVDQIGIGTVVTCPEGSGPSFGGDDLSFDFDDDDDETNGDSSDSVTSRDEPAALGTTLQVGDWSVAVNSFTGDVTEAIAGENSFNAPEDGKIFVGVHVTMQYNGDGSTTGNDLSMSLLSTSGIAVDNRTMSDGPEALDTWVDVYTGATLEGNMFFEIDPSDVNGALLVIEPMLSFGDEKEFFTLD